ncbi:MAG: GGDEF domain-containing protein [Lachnospiraceae bacterium]|jgi:diguanylate cyclase (GGDEF)-like protein|nr:GGDEF domain-containing protein [Lachnospiraceae bacterium]
MWLVNFINKDVVAQNENKRSMVALRILYMVLFVAFAADVLAFGVDAFNVFPYRVFGFFAVNIVLFALTYNTRTRTSVIMFVFYVFAWTLAMIPCFGWSAGMQNYYIIILMLCFFAVPGKPAYKFVLASIVLVARIATIGIYGGVKPIAEIASIQDKILQISNISAVYIAIILISYIYSHDENEAEGKLMKYNDKLKKEAGTDQLTGLVNRRRALEYLQELRDASFSSFISIAMGDIDFFKKVNDTYGHDAGDEVLKSVANTMKEVCGSKGLVSRWGGEEFLIIFVDVNGDDAFIDMEKLRREISKRTIVVGEQKINITMTIGLTEYNIKKNIENAIKEADEKLYLGKTNGRNQVVY